MMKTTFERVKAPERLATLVKEGDEKAIVHYLMGLLFAVAVELRGGKKPLPKKR